MIPPASSYAVPVTIGQIETKLPLKRDVLHDLVPFLQFKNCEKHPINVSLLHRCFSSFLNCTNGNKS